MSSQQSQAVLVHLGKAADGTGTFSTPMVQRTDMVIVCLMLNEGTSESL